MSVELLSPFQRTGVAILYMGKLNYISKNE